MPLTDFDGQMTAYDDGAIYAYTQCAKEHCRDCREGDELVYNEHKKRWFHKWIFTSGTVDKEFAYTGARVAVPQYTDCLAQFEQNEIAKLRPLVDKKK